MDSTYRMILAGELMMRGVWQMDENNDRVECLYDFEFCFFFQAEDGIRDLYVTGVQTCALPISRLRWRSVAERTRWRLRHHIFVSGLIRLRSRSRSTEIQQLRVRLCQRASDFVFEHFGKWPQRSEERRVGKEWRSRRSRAP